jgi:hypothetical protein
LFLCVVWEAFEVATTFARSVAEVHDIAIPGFRALARGARRVFLIRALSAHQSPVR